MSDWRHNRLATKMLVCSWTVRELLVRIDDLETDEKLSTNEKFSQIKIIKEEISKVGAEIDKIKNEIMILNAHSVN